MSTSKIKGVIKEITPIESYNEGAGRKQTMVVFSPGFVDRYTGEKKGPDNEWGIEIFNDQIEKHGLNINCVDKRVEVEVNLRGRSFDRRDGSKGYGISATLVSYTLGENAGTNFKESDGLPF